MAEEKKSFILYADLIHTVRKMPQDKVADLFITILDYVNDENPTVDDLVVDLVFEPIKQQLKRDLRRWENFRKKQAENGRLGGRPKKDLGINENPENPGLFQETQKSPNVTVNVNDTVTVTDTVTDKKDSVCTGKPDTPPAKALEEKVKQRINRQLKFKNSLREFVPTYGKEMIQNFYDYWIEPNRSATKMKWELEKTWDLKLRLIKWESNEKTFRKGNNSSPPDGSNYLEQRKQVEDKTRQIANS